MYQGVPQICSGCGYRPPSTRETIELNIPCNKCGYIGVSNGPQPQRPVPHQEPQMVRTAQVPLSGQCLPGCSKRESPALGYQLPPPDNKAAPIFQPNQQSSPIAQPRAPVQQNAGRLQMSHVSSIRTQQNAGMQESPALGYQLPPPDNKAAPIFQPNQQSSPIAQPRAPVQQNAGRLQMSHVSSIRMPTGQFVPSEQCLRCCFKEGPQEPGFKAPLSINIPAPNFQPTQESTPKAKSGLPALQEGHGLQMPQLSSIAPLERSGGLVGGGNEFRVLDEASSGVQQWYNLPCATYNVIQSPNLHAPAQAPCATYNVIQSPNLHAPAQAPAVQPMGSVQQQLHNFPAPAVQPMESVQQQPHNAPAPMQAPASLQAPGAAGITFEIPGLTQRPPKNSLVLLPFSDLLELSQNQSDTSGSQLLQQASTESSATGSKVGPLCFLVLQPITPPSQLQESNGLKPPGPPTAGAAAALENHLPQAARDSLSTSSRAPEELGQRLLAGIQQREMLRRGSKPQSGDAGNIRQLQTQPPKANDAATSQQPLSEIQPESARVIQSPAVAEEQHISSQGAALARPQRLPTGGASEAVSSQTGQHDSQVASHQLSSRLDSILATAEDTLGSPLERIRRDFGIAYRLNR